jgi:hypothetical protein
MVNVALSFIKVVAKIAFICLCCLVGAVAYAGLIYFCDYFYEPQSVFGEWYDLTFIYTLPYGAVLGIVIAGAFLGRRKSSNAGLICTLGGGCLLLWELWLAWVWLSSGVLKPTVVVYILPLMIPLLLLVYGILWLNEVNAHRDKVS